MGIREALNRNPKAAVIIFGVALLALLGVAIVQFKGRSGGGSSGTGSPQAWYTEDDGKTWFADDAGRLSPFDHNGKQAYRCYVWTCDGGKTQFVSHLERLKPERLKEHQAAAANKSVDFILPDMDMLVKPPLTGDRGWVGFSTPAGQAIRTPRPPPGQHGTPEPVEAK
jgi:hypothetical protein